MAIVVVVVVVVIVVVVVAAVVREGACVAVVTVAVAVVPSDVTEVTDDCDAAEEAVRVADVFAAVVVCVATVSHVDAAVCSVVVVTRSVVWTVGTPVLCVTADDGSEKVSSPQAHKLISIPTNNTNANTRFIRIPLFLYVDTLIVDLIFEKVKTEFFYLFTITSQRLPWIRV